MAAQQVLFSMEGEAHIAFIAVEDAAAFKAVEVGGEAAAVEIEDTLGAALELLADHHVELAGDQAAAVRVVEPAVELDDMGSRQAVGGRPARQSEQPVFAFSGIVKRLERRCGGAENDVRLEQLAAQHRDIPGMIPGRGILLVA